LNTIADGQPDVHNAYTSNEFLHPRGLPTPARGARARHIQQREANASNPFGTTITVIVRTWTITVDGTRRCGRYETGPGLLCGARALAGGGRGLSSHVAPAGRPLSAHARQRRERHAGARACGRVGRRVRSRIG